MTISEKTPVQISAVLILGSMATGMGVFLMELYSAQKVNANEIRAHDEQITELRRSVQIMHDMKTDVAVIREKVERIERRR